jgi:hypothetical protein
MRLLLGIVMETGKVTDTSYAVTGKFASRDMRRPVVLLGACTCR